MRNRRNRCKLSCKLHAKVSAGLGINHGKQQELMAKFETKECGIQSINASMLIPDRRHGTLFLVQFTREKRQALQRTRPLEKTLAAPACPRPKRQGGVYGYDVNNMATSCSPALAPSSPSLSSPPLAPLTAIGIGINIDTAVTFDIVTTKITGAGRRCARRTGRRRRRRRRQQRWLR